MAIFQADYAGVDLFEIKKNKRKILRTRGQYFSWKHGLTGKPAPDRILEAGVQPATFKELVEEIQQREKDESHF